MSSKSLPTAGVRLLPLGVTPASQVLPAPPPLSRRSAELAELPVIQPTFALPISQRGESWLRSSCLATSCVTVRLAYHSAGVPWLPQPVCATPCCLRPRLEDSASGPSIWRRPAVRSGLVTVRHLADQPLQWSRSMGCRSWVSLLPSTSKLQSSGSYPGGRGPLRRSRQPLLDGQDP